MNFTKILQFFFHVNNFFFEGNLQQIISSCWRGNELVFFSVWIITWGAFFALSVYYFYEHHRDDHKRYICWNLLSKVIICWELLFLTSSIRIAKWLRNYYFSGNFFFFRSFILDSLVRDFCTNVGVYVWLLQCFMKLFLENLFKGLNKFKGID